MIKIISDYGFCPGLTKAIENLSPLYFCNNKVYLTNPIMHNEKEMQKFLDSKKFFYIDDNKITSKDIVVFPTHGSKLELKDKYKSYTTVDLICPVIKARYDFLSNHYDETKKYYLVGDKNHHECAAMLSNYNFLNILDPNDTHFIKSICGQDINLLSQTTLQDDTFQSVAHLLSLKNNVSIIFNPCMYYLTRIDESIFELDHLDKSDSIVIVLGSKTSSNCNAIFNILKNKYKDLNMIIANDFNDIPKEFLSLKNFYLVASTSISAESCEEIRDKIVEYTKQY